MGMACYFVLSSNLTRKKRLSDSQDLMYPSTLVNLCAICMLVFLDFKIGFYAEFSAGTEVLASKQ